MATMESKIPATLATIATFRKIQENGGSQDRLSPKICQKNGEKSAVWDNMVKSGCFGCFRGVLHIAINFGVLRVRHAVLIRAEGKDSGTS